MTTQAKWFVVGGLGVVWLTLLYVYVIDVPPPHEVPLKFTSGQVAVRQPGSSPLLPCVWALPPL